MKPHLAPHIAQGSHARPTPPAKLCTKPWKNDKDDERDERFDGHNMVVFIYGYVLVG